MPVQGRMGINSRGLTGMLDSARDHSTSHYSSSHYRSSHYRSGLGTRCQPQTQLRITALRITALRITAPGNSWYLLPTADAPKTGDAILPFH